MSTRLDLQLLTIIESNVASASGVAQSPCTQITNWATSARQCSILATVAFETSRLLSVDHAPMLRLVRSCVIAAVTTVPSTNSPETNGIVRIQYVFLELHPLTASNI